MVREMSEEIVVSLFEEVLSWKTGSALLEKGTLAISGNFGDLVEGTDGVHLAHT